MFILHRSIFSAVYDVHLEKASAALSDTETESVGRKSSGSNRHPSSYSYQGGSATPPAKIDKRLAQVHVSNL